ncbi:MAG: metal-dependent hydrolase [Nitrospiraceae bacterium]
MASAFAHAVASSALGITLGLTRAQWRLLALGAVCAILPDIDSLGYWAGIPYDHVLGHRGLTHSIVFAALLSAAIVVLWYRRVSTGERARIGLFLFLATLSHGLLDALTNGGLGVAFFAPFSNGRYFFPIRPIEVSPLEPDRFFTLRGLQILASEALWVGVPSLLLVAVARLFRRTAVSPESHKRSYD